MPQSFKYLVFVSAVLLGAPVWAFGPAKPSDLVTLISSDAHCIPDVMMGNPTKAINQRVLADGSVVPFVIPARNVLVVTGIEWRQASTGSSTTGEDFYLFTESAAGGLGGVLVDSFSPPNASARAGASIPVTGVSIKAGSTVCFQVETGYIETAVAYVHGYLTKDR